MNPRATPEQWEAIINRILELPEPVAGVESGFTLYIALCMKKPPASADQKYTWFNGYKNELKDYISQSSTASPLRRASDPLTPEEIKIEKLRAVLLAVDNATVNLRSRPSL